MQHTDPNRDDYVPSPEQIAKDRAWLKAEGWKPPTMGQTLRMFWAGTFRKFESSAQKREFVNDMRATYYDLPPLP